MVKHAIRKLVDFSVGIALGGAIGAGIGYLTAPVSGHDLRQEGRDLIASAKEAGERARIDRENALRDKFRGQVGNQAALSEPVDETARASESPPAEIPFPV